MQKKNLVIEDEPAPAITPDVLSKIKKDDAKQAAVEQFKGSAELASPARPKKRSPYWQPADDQC